MIEENAGENVLFKCTSVTKVEWKFNDKFLPVNSKEYKLSINTYMLEIYNVQLDNAGFYECTGTTVEKVHFYSRGYLSVKG